MALELVVLEPEVPEQVSALELVPVSVLASESALELAPVLVLASESATAELDEPEASSSLAPEASVSVSVAQQEPVFPDSVSP